ncbi:Ets DNA-binding protein pokkuri [Orchesella cincta]|uniref:Ets DNA-binding protein pokkuri n=1 Tax=Orchesella cincta TaxID=48709 RepID=A0A1D2MNT1_ORCCI|nr:Ets DNA-binding protein pokkuri [Orchesella cincta]
MLGKALCLLTKADLESRVPCSGDVIHNSLQLLMTSGDSPLTPHTPSSLRIPQLGVNGKGVTWSITDLQQYAAAQQQQATTSVTLSPAPSLDGQAGSPQDHGNGQTSQHLSSASSSTGSGGPPSDDSEYDSVGESPERSPPIQSMSPPPSHSNSTNNHSANGGHHHHHSHHHSNSTNGASNGASTIAANSNGNGAANVTAKSSFSPGSKLTNGAAGTAEAGEYNNNGRLLWDFLQQLLNDPAQRYSNFIAWKNVDTGIFKIVDPPGLARLWGIQKNHLSMNYDKMSRALRYYYRVNILRKVQGERHCYQFLRNPGELKSIKNISMLRHQQNSPMSLSVKSDTTSYGNENGSNGNDYDSKYSLLSHHHQQQQHNSPVSLTVKSESMGYGRESASDDYESKLSMLGHRQQSSPVSLTTKNCSASPSSTSSTSSIGAPGGDSYENGDYDSINGHPQESPMSLTTKSSPSHHHHQDNDGVDSRGHRPKPQLSPVSLTVKSEPTTAFITADDDYEDVPTDLSMETERDRQSKEED